MWLHIGVEQSSVKTPQYEEVSGEKRATACEVPFEILGYGEGTSDGPSGPLVFPSSFTDCTLDA